jgi:hypothetical protein
MSYKLLILVKGLKWTPIELFYRRLLYKAKHLGKEQPWGSFRTDELLPTPFSIERQLT